MPGSRTGLLLPIQTATTEGAPSVSSGILLVDKPAGITSHDVVAIVRRALASRRVGHTGTLDPFATGLLVVLVGNGTRLIQFIDGEPKVYEAVIRFGTETDTDDVTGQVVRSATPPTGAAIDAAMARLTGEIDQVPPAYSAKHVGGVRAYAAARRGAPLTLDPARVTVHEWTLIARTADSVTARVTCTGGTYIRALARDLGRLAGSAAHLAALRRTRSGQFSVDEAATLDEICGGPTRLLPLRAAVPSFPAQRLDAGELGRVRHGNAVVARVDAPRVALVDDDETLIAVAERSGGELRPVVVFEHA